MNRNKTFKDKQTLTLCVERNALKRELFWESKKADNEKKCAKLQERIDEYQDEIDRRAGLPTKEDLQWG